MKRIKIPGFIRPIISQSRKTGMNTQLLFVSDLFVPVFSENTAPCSHEHLSDLYCTLHHRGRFGRQPYPCSRLSTFCFDALAWASMAVDACCRIWFFASWVVSKAKSAPSIPPLAADKLAEILVRLFTVCVRRLEISPSLDRWVGGTSF